MRLVGRWVGAVVVACLSVTVACGGKDGQPGGTGSGSDSGSGAGAGGGGGSGGGGGTPDGGTGSGGATDGGTGGGTAVPDGGTGVSDGGTGVPDGGTGVPDGGTGGQDGGTVGTDAGTLQTFTFPTAPGWQFFGPQSGGPQDVFDAAFDEGGNLWVAGGSEGLFLMRAAGGALSGHFEKFGLAQGLHPYGWVNGEVAKAMGVPDGTPADKNPSLTATPVISVAGGPAGTVFVGYKGKTSTDPRADCESAWSGDQYSLPSTWGDPSVYKSGDADRVTLTGSGISVVHYDIFSGPGVVNAEVKGREKLCSVYRIVWDKAKNNVWFGGNHGFAVAQADAPNTPTCNGEPACSPVWEHSHPAISGCAIDYDLTTSYCPPSKATWLTDAYYGVAVDPMNHDLWMGGANRSTKFHSGTYNGNYDWAENDTEDQTCSHTSPVCAMADRWDLWPDNQPEWDAKHGTIYISPLMRSTPGATVPDYALDDAISGIAARPDGTAWFGSFAHGLLRVDSAGAHKEDATARIMTKYVSSVALDPKDSGVWVGMQYGPGISRIDGSGNVINYSYGAPYDSNATLGDKLSNAAVANIQSGGTGASRRMVAGFHKFSLKDPVTKVVTSYAGAVAVYSGN